MNNRRAVIIAAALAFAAVAFVGNVVYLSTTQSRANHNARLVTAWKVAKAIPKGTTGEQAKQENYIVKTQVPDQYRPKTAILDAPDTFGKIAITDVAPDQIVVTGMFVNPDVAQVTFAQRVPKGQIAFSISIDQVHGVAGLLQPGDQVNAMVVTTPTGNTSGDQDVVISTLYQNVNILAIGARTAAQAGDASKGVTTTAVAAADTGLITFTAPPEAAERLLKATTGSNSLYLALVPPGNPAVEINGINNSNFQSKAAKLADKGDFKTPYGQ